MENMEQKNTWLDNVFQKDGTPPLEFIEAMQAHAGLEPAYQRSILKKKPNPCQWYSLADHAKDGWAAYQFDFPKEGRGVIEIIRRPESKGDPAILKLRGLDTAAHYSEMKGYAGNLGPSPVWGSGSMVMLSNVVPLPSSNVGLALEEANTSMRGRELLDRGLPVTLAKSSQVIWIVYHRAK